MYKVAVTGHRPDKLGGYNATDKHKLIKLHMERFLKELQKDFHELTLIGGGALGIDQFWMETGLKLNIPVIAAIPFKGYDNKWPLESRKIFEKLLDKCVEVRYICGEYSKRAYQTRNEWMVDNCNLLVGYYDGTSGGTKNCLSYAQSKKCDLVIYDVNEILKNE